MAVGCGNTTNSHSISNKSSDCDTIRTEDVKELIKHKKLSEVHSIWKCVVEKDTLIESDDDVSWKANAFYKNQTLLFTVETNWQDSNQVKRINIYSDEIADRNNIRVGASFRAISTFVDAMSLPSLPDGYLAVIDGTDKTVLYFIDIEKYPKLQQGVSSTSQIPENAKVLYISVKID